MTLIVRVKKANFFLETSLGIIDSAIFKEVTIWAAWIEHVLSETLAGSILSGADSTALWHWLKPSSALMASLVVSTLRLGLLASALEVFIHDQRGKLLGIDISWLYLHLSRISAG